MLLVGIGLVLATTAASALAAGAAVTTTSAPAPTTTSPLSAGPSINGTLVAGDTPISGVHVTVTKDGKPVGTAVTGADGKFRIAVPGAGIYSVTLDKSTIPTRFQLVNPSDISRPNFQVYGNFPQFVVFPFKGVSKTDLTAVPQSRFTHLLNLFVGGIRFGLIIGLCSVGLSLIYGTTRLVNFAHGELVTFGALVAFFFNADTGGPQLSLAIATVLAVVFGGLLGGALELGLWRPIAHRTTNNARMLVSIGLALFLRYLFQVIFTGSSRTFRQYSAQGPTKIGPIQLPVRDYVIMLVCVIALVGVAFVLERTRLGTAVRAVADERELASASGIDVGRVILAVWVGGAALSALGGVLLAVDESVQWNMGFRLLLTIFAAVVLGGLGSAYGAMAGGLVVGVASEVSTYWLPADFKIAVGLGILVLVLLVRPQGMLGVRERVG
jgi:branched-chain amino acid transport system permease protein